MVLIYRGREVCWCSVAKATTNIDRRTHHRQCMHHKLLPGYQVFRSRGYSDSLSRYACYYYC